MNETNKHNKDKKDVAHKKYERSAKEDNKHEKKKHNHHEHMVQDFRTRFFVSLIISIPIIILSPMIQDFLGLEKGLQFKGDIYLLFSLSTAIFIYGGYPFLKGFIQEIRSANPGMMTLISVAITTAFLYSSVVVFGLEGRMFFWELATLIDIMLLGHWIEMKSVLGASRALEEMAQLIPAEAHKITSDNNIEDVPVSELQKEDRVLVKPGEKIPADGKIIDGKSSINEAVVTGESKPVSKEKDDQVIGGSVNGNGSITIQVTKTGEDSYLSQIMDLVKQAQQSKSQTQDIANRAAFILTVVALTAGGITFIVWLLAMAKELSFALERTVTVMVITCPHALGLAVPLVVAVSTSLAARHGLLIRNRTSFEKARGIEAIIFDKTGTLTEGTFSVSKAVSLTDEFKEEEILSHAASVETHSEHPIAAGITDATDRIYEVSDFESISGKGVKGTVKNKRVMVVSAGYLKEQGISIAEEKNENMLKEGKTIVYVLIDDTLAGAIALGDKIREESREAISRLKKMGIQCMMLTGDKKEVAEWVAREIGLDEYFAEILPEQKAAKIKEIKERGLIVAMTGDGVNDAPALAESDVGIAIGAGTEVAIESADIILVKSNPLDVVSIIGLSKATYSKMLQNLGWATGYNVIAIPLAAGVLYSLGILLSPAIGALLMSLSTVIVAINARLLKL